MQPIKLSLFHVHSAMLVALLVAATTTHADAAANRDASKLLDKSIPELQTELDAGHTTSVALVRMYLDRIEKLDRAGPKVHSVLAINPDALRQARDFDRERRERGKRGPLHGIPILLKDNIESLDPMPTTAGSLALANNLSNRDAIIAANLRSAGAIILGKTNLSEWANYRSDHSISGWSGLGGLTKNPHVLDRSACGSSAGSGAAIAAQFAVASVGTETDGSITCPASINGVIGIKPTAGLLSQQGIVPIAHSQDTAGPMGRSVTDVAIMLNAMMSACATASTCRKVDYLAALPSASLQGKRIGVLHFRGPRSPLIEAVYEKALQTLRDAGAILIETQLPDNPRIRAAEETVLQTEFKTDLNTYLSHTPSQVTTRSLAQLIEFNNTHPRETVLFGQEIFIRSNATNGLNDASYQSALADSKRLAGAEGLSKVLEADHLDFLVAPTTGNAWRVDLVGGDRFSGSFSTLPAVSGYPHLTIPMGLIHNLPIGLSFIGLPWSEELLIGAAYVFEQRTHAIVKAQFKPTLEGDNPNLQP
jgi:amidase